MASQNGNSHQYQLKYDFGYRNDDLVGKNGIDDELVTTEFRQGLVKNISMQLY